MDSKKLSIILQRASEILIFYDNVPIEDALDDIYKIVRKEKRNREDSSSKSEQEVEIVFTDDIINEMSNMNSEELTKFLNENENFQSRGALLKLAKTLSITTSSRNNHSTLLHSILKYFERKNMDKLIREDRNTFDSIEEKI